MDNTNFSIRIKLLRRIIYCGRSVIPDRKSWDLYWLLYTGAKKALACYLDNYRFFTAYNKTYAQSKWAKNILIG
ncbi:hypothetical protein MA13_contig00008-0185 [Edwardsiella piscicida]|nr:hypothetical protein MA13_contig00008-0185 [Edwardsiella piscicida]